MPGTVSDSPVLIKLTNVAWAGVREYNDHVVSLGMLSVIDLHWDILMCATESGKEIKNRVAPPLSMNIVIWQKDAELHEALVRVAPVLDDFVDATEDLKAFEDFDS